LLLAFGLQSCSSSKPSLLALRWTVIDRPGAFDGAGAETLSVFASVDDEDGIDDLDKLYIINDSNETLWKLDKNSWEKSEMGGDTWIGSNALSLSDGTDIPAGTYRVLITDSSGERAEQSFSVTDNKEVAAIKLSGTRDALEIMAPYPSTQLLCFDLSSTLSKSVGITPGTIRLSDAADAATANGTRSVSVISMDESKHRAIISERLNLQ
jgi:hypothetical protein